MQLQFLMTSSISLSISILFSISLIPKHFLSRSLNEAPQWNTLGFDLDIVLIFAVENFDHKLFFSLLVEVQLNLFGNFFGLFLTASLILFVSTLYSLLDLELTLPSFHHTYTLYMICSWKHIKWSYFNNIIMFF